MPPSDWTVREAPGLRIVDDALWQRVQTRRQAGEDRRNNPSPRTPLPLTGLVRCAVCGGTMTIAKHRRYDCHAHRAKGTCDNPRGIDATRLENAVFALLSRGVAEDGDVPGLVRRAGEEATRRRQRLAGEIADGERRMARLLDAIEQGAQSNAAHRRILEIEHEIAETQLELDALPAIPERAPDGLAARLHDRLALLGRAVADARPGEEPRRRALLIAKDLIERIDIAPLPGRGQVDIAVLPRTDALVAFALDKQWSFAHEAREDPA